jgi:hypothetical protein
MNVTQTVLSAWQAELRLANWQSAGVALQLNMDSQVTNF